MKNNICKVLGENIKKLRKTRSLTQNELAELIGIEVKSMSLIETGKGFVSAKTLEKLALELNVPVSEFFKVSDSEANEVIYSEIISNLDIIKHNT
ncbi:MAG: helix-turn-helix domain-containing protein, partial [Candidatus Gastranaerophilales bacterium]|nr:helix-turn-helix domain-containing protein [Candidatus Gastranaerophilales bacterium]